MSIHGLTGRRSMAPGERMIGSRLGWWRPHHGEAASLEHQAMMKEPTTNNEDSANQGAYLTGRHKGADIHADTPTAQNAKRPPRDLIRGLPAAVRLAR